MNLWVDIGNSRIKWVEQIDRQYSALHARPFNKSDIAGDLDQWWESMTRPDRIGVANVAGTEVEEGLTEWAVSHWNTPPQFARVTASAHGVTNGYADYSRLGIDRWLTLIAAWNEYRHAACIVDCGTAVTIDGLDSSGRHLGGLILPGITLMQQSLAKASPAIPDSRPAAGRGLANNTAEAVATGCVLAASALIERAMRDLRQQHGGKFVTLLTGGDAGQFMDFLPAGVIFKPLLVIEGLAIVANTDP